MATNIGTVIEGKYEILKLIGTGGMSYVYLAMDKRLNKQWAVKEIKKTANGKNDEIIENSLLTEANLMKKLDHPALPRIVDIIDNGETIYVIMDYIEGESLDKILCEYGAQPQELVIDWAKQVCDALQYLHSQNPPIIYRDMKPSNIMLKPEGNIKIIDFGIAREYKEQSLADTKVLGTKGYASPEHYGNRQTDARSDIYTLGMTMHHLLTGADPRPADYMYAPIRQWNPELSGGLERIIDKCTALNPDERYQTCNELMYALEHYEEEDGSYKKKQKRKLVSFIVTAFMTIIMIITGIFGKVMTSYENDKNYNQKINKSEDDAKDEYKDYKKKSEDDSYEDDEVGKTSNEIKNQENLPSKGGGSEKKEKTAQISKVTSFLTNLFSDGILDSLENLGKSFRDDLYTTDYVMNMFSYDTFVNEGKKKYTEDTNSTISTENFEKNKDKTFGYNKTLTNMPINKDNNFAYQGEVEYILYGNYNAINKANSYGRIFLLRYAFNVAPVFQKFWKDDAVRVAAHGISLATYGVIPESLVKIAICLMLNVGETVEDIIVLRSGEGVKLVKSKDEVSIQFPSKKKKNTSSSKNDFKPRYSDYISLFLFLKLASSSENEIYKRIADVVQVNMAKITKKKSFVLEKAVVYYQIKSDISIPPLMLNLQINKGESAYNLNILCDYEYKNIAGY